MPRRTPTFERDENGRMAERHYHDSGVAPRVTFHGEAHGSIVRESVIIRPTDQRNPQNQNNNAQNNNAQNNNNIVGSDVQRNTQNPQNWQQNYNVGSPSESTGSNKR